MAEQFVAVKVGRGNEVHAGREYDRVQKGRFEYVIYRHICGSGNSSGFHNFRTANCKALPKGTEITCKKCLARIAQE